MQMLQEKNRGEGDTLSPLPTLSTPAAPHLELRENLLQGLRRINTLE